ncbi:GNAT family N-acetyltransferase [Subtercola frigoramans]|uniref:GNAT superfamily N-acetyltransferase n=1 Tax=Subtercola frigoramans TaxID=120298 RepID=A0ABS2L044_9MICO|nr:GNAT family N-acetyltransferase [Subtercola frigoramans]MBM7470427.1 GNAT superfamily N-acetyltransferase [Subtercola frigoramans]
MTVTIEVTAWSDPDGVKLRAAQRTELDTRYGADTEPGVKPTADDIAVFLIARDTSGEAIGCGALRLLGDGTAEIKRMFVVAAARGTGASTLLLHRLESEAVARGITRLLLETGPAQPDAVRFYQREGYTRAAAFGHYVDSATSLFFGRDL